MEWGAANADIVSMSLGSLEASDGTDIMSEALNEISAATGTLFVVAAGNSGAPGTIGAPAAAERALTIGSIDDATGWLSWFTSQGPLVTSGALKPDVTAPGGDITAARSSYATAWGDGYYTSMSGTSMDTPHVAGAAAIALQADPDLTAEQLKDLLVSTADDLGFTAYQGGTGVIDVLAAAEQDVFATGSVDFGLLAWGEPSGAIAKDVTFTNRSDADVTLDLELSTSVSSPGSGGGGGIIPGAVTLAAGQPVELSQDQVTVPAGGTATVTLTGDHGELAPGEQLSGVLVGTVDGQPATRTAIGMIAELEQYDLTLRSIGRDGSATLTYVMLFGLDTGLATSIPVDGEITMRLPAGRYSAMTFADTLSSAGKAAIALVGDPDVVLDRDRVVDLDVRAAVPVTADVGQDGLMADFRRIDYKVEGFTGMAAVPLLVDEILAQPLVAENVEEFSFTTRWRLREPRVTLTLDGLDLEPVAQVGVPTLDGDLSGPATYLGTGSASDVSGVDLAGGIAVVRASVDVASPDRVANAAAAGASLLVVVDQQDQYEWYGDFLGNDGPIPVLAVGGAQGAQLLAALEAGDVTLTAIGQPVAENVYDILLYTEGEIPQNPTKVADDLALITTTYHGTENSVVSEFRYDFAPGVQYASGWGGATARPGVRNEWVSTTDVAWYQDATDVEWEWEVRDVRRTNTAGEEVESSFFGPIVRPYVGPGFWAPLRQFDGMQINIPSWADGESAERTGNTNTYAQLPGFTQLGQLYLDGALISDSLYQGVYAWGLPSEEKTYRFVNTTTHDAAMIPTSVKTVTEWEFLSAAGGWGDTLPMIQAYYGVDAAIDGVVGSGRAPGEPVSLDLELGHVGGAVRSAPLVPSSISLEFSTDGGESWQELELAEAAAADTAEREYVRSFDVAIPVSDDGAEVSLRAKAADELGNSFSQEITTAFIVAAAEEPEPTDPPTTGEPTDPPTTGEPTDEPTSPSPTDEPTSPSPSDSSSATPGPGGSMPVTGAGVGLLVVLAAAAIGTGVLLRRRRAAA